jgi:hypothetical protein
MVLTTPVMKLRQYEDSESTTVTFTCSEQFSRVHFTKRYSVRMMTCQLVVLPKFHT